MGLERLAKLPRAEGVRLRPASDADRDGIRSCYAAHAAETNGLLDRPEFWWEYRESRRIDAGSYVAVDSGDRILGYLIYTRRDGPLGPDAPFQLAVDEFVWRTRDAGLALWQLIASYATQVEKVFLVGAVEDPSLLILPEQVFETLVEIRWMLRVVDAEAAVSARGFPPGLSAEIPLEIEDALLPVNSGAYTLHVESGRGVLKPGGQAGPRLDVGAFSSLYAGFSTTADLVRAGRLAGGRDEQGAALDAVFAGPTPALLDEF